MKLLFFFFSSSFTSAFPFLEHFPLTVPNSAVQTIPKEYVSVRGHNSNNSDDNTWFRFGKHKEFGAGRLVCIQMLEKGLSTVKYQLES